MNRPKTSLRSRGSSSSTGSNPRKHVRDCCRKFIAFMCTQVGVGGLIVGYAIVGALGFMSIETQEGDPLVTYVQNLRRNCALELYAHSEHTNMFSKAEWSNQTDVILRNYEKDISQVIKKGYDGRLAVQIWSFPAALMFCLSVFTMIGYGHMVPRTQWGKGVTVIYATFGIPLYILYFLNMGKVLAKSFKLLYTMVHECTHNRPRRSSDLEDGEFSPPPKRIIVPSTACLWVISFYVFTGTVMFANWENWSYLDSIYFCVTSLCKIGIGDFVPGASFRKNVLKDNANGEVANHITDREEQIKLAINFIYMLIGMGLVAMCYNLMREEVRVKMQEIKEDLRLCLEDLRDRFTMCCGNRGEEEYY